MKVHGVPSDGGLKMPRSVRFHFPSTLTPASRSPGSPAGETGHTVMGTMWRETPRGGEPQCASRQPSLPKPGPVGKAILWEPQ